MISLHTATPYWSDRAI